MSEMQVTVARQHLSDLVNRAAYRGERVYLTRRGRRLAALVPVELLEAIEAAEDAQAAQDLEAAQAALAEDGPRISLEQLREELGHPAHRLTGLTARDVDLPQVEGS